MGTLFRAFDGAVRRVVRWWVQVVREERRREEIEHPEYVSECR